MIICNSKKVEAIRAGDTRFLTASIPLPDLPLQMTFCVKLSALLRVGGCHHDGQSMDVVAALAREDILVMGHLGLVPREPPEQTGSELSAKPLMKLLSYTRPSNGWKRRAAYWWKLFRQYHGRNF